MHHNRMLVTGLIFAVISACSSQEYLTNKEVENQNQASLAITGTLFDNDIDETATYSIDKEGHVDISFDKSVSEETYTKVVTELRKNPLINGVWASQGGVQVCPLP